jgi:DNA-binding LytR/AlgR family response regulator
MITAIAIDDEPLALEVVKSFCSRVDYIDLKATFTETGKALKYLEEHPVNLLLLDINMPAISGIDFYKKVPGEPMVIFTTAFTQYAVEGFNLNAIDYLLKPFEFERFRKAMEKAKDFHQHHQHKADVPEYLFFRVDYSMVKVAIADIAYIEGLDNYIKLHYHNGKTLLVRMSMKSIEAKLPAGVFVRVHRSYIVAIAAVRSVRGRTIYLDAGELPISANYAGEVQKLFEPI